MDVKDGKISTTITNIKTSPSGKLSSSPIPINFNNVVIKKEPELFNIKSEVPAISNLLNVPAIPTVYGSCLCPKHKSKAKPVELKVESDADSISGDSNYKQNIRRNIVFDLPPDNKDGQVTTVGKSACGSSKQTRQQLSSRNSNWSDSEVERSRRHKKKRPSYYPYYQNYRNNGHYYSNNYRRNCNYSSPSNEQDYHTFKKPFSWNKRSEHKKYNKDSSHKSNERKDSSNNSEVEENNNRLKEPSCGTGDRLQSINRLKPPPCTQENKSQSSTSTLKSPSTFRIKLNRSFSLNNNNNSSRVSCTDDNCANSSSEADINLVGFLCMICEKEKNAEVIDLVSQASSPQSEVIDVFDSDSNSGDKLLQDRDTASVASTECSTFSNWKRCDDIDCRSDDESVVSSVTTLGSSDSFFIE